MRPSWCHARLLVLMFLIGAPVVTLRAASYLVTTNADSGEGSLRWAIARANATAGRDFIRARCSGGCVVELSSPLPAIQETATIDHFVINGAAAGLEANGLVLASDVEVDNVTVMNFGGDGFVLEGNGNSLHYVDASGNRNGVVISGDNNAVYGSRLIANLKNGVWVTSGAMQNQIGRVEEQCYFDPCISFPGPNTIEGSGMSGVLIEGTALVEANDLASNGTGITVRRAGSSLLGNNSHHNLGYGVALSAPAVAERNTGACNGSGLMGGGVIAAPVVTEAVADPTATRARGEFSGTPNTTYTAELHGGGSCESDTTSYLGSRQFVTDGAGQAVWTITAQAGEPPAEVFAVVTRPTSHEVSAASAVVPAVVTNEKDVDLAVRVSAPEVAISGSEVVVITTVTNNGPGAIYGFKLSIPGTTGTTYVSAQTTSGECYLYGLRLCAMGQLAPGESATVRQRLRVTATDGVLTHVATATLWDDRAFDPNPLNSSVTTVVPVGAHVAPVPLSPAAIFSLTALLALIGLSMQRR
jgi:hypothetical protein